MYMGSSSLNLYILKYEKQRALTRRTQSGSWLILIDDEFVLSKITSQVQFLPYHQQVSIENCDDFSVGIAAFILILGNT